MRGIILVIALIGGVYAFGRYSSDNERLDEDSVIKIKGMDIIIKICLAFVASIIIASIFIILFITGFVFNFSIIFFRIGVAPIIAIIIVIK